MNKYAVVYVAWGEKYINEVIKCIEKSESLAKYDILLITDNQSKVAKPEAFSKVIRTTFKTEGLLRKSEMILSLPDTYECYLYLDSDTLILKDISLGFKKALIHDVALAKAPLYSLDMFWGFDEILKAENVPCEGQLLYNSGVIFFKNSTRVKDLFYHWNHLALKYSDSNHGDQPFLTLALEQFEFNPYTLSISYNYRGVGEYIIGPVRLWHSRGEIPKDLNEKVSIWPPRKAWPSKVVYPKQKKSYLKKILDNLTSFK